MLLRLYFFFYPFAQIRFSSAIDGQSLARINRRAGHAEVANTGYQLESCLIDGFPEPWSESR